jgi:hypothetical protein
MERREFLDKPDNDWPGPMMRRKSYALPALNPEEVHLR